MKKILLVTLLLLMVPLCVLAAGIENILTKEYMPDEGFRTKVAQLANEKYGRSTNTLSEEEAATWTNLNVGYCSISDAKGIEYFPALTEFTCYMNSWTELDVSHNPALTKLECRDSSMMTKLNVSQNPALTTLLCHGCKLADLDVSHNPALTELECYDNNLTELDVSHNPALTKLGCHKNQLKTLDVTQNTNLTYLSCDSNQLKTLDITHNPALSILNCSSNQLTTLDVTHNSVLTTLNCFSNQLKTLDVTHNPMLTFLNCSSNQLTTLDLSSQNPDELGNGGISQQAQITVQNNNGVVTADLSKLVGPANIKNVSVEKGTYNTATGIYTFSGTPKLHDTFVYYYNTGLYLHYVNGEVKPLTMDVTVEITGGDGLPASTPTQGYELSNGEDGKIKSLFFLWNGKKAKSASVEVGKEEKFSFDFTYKNGYSASLQLSSSNPGIAQAYFVDGKELKLVTTKVGSCVITCQDTISKKKCTLKVKVTAPAISSIAIAENEYHLKKGETLDLGSKFTIQPAEAAGEPLKYTSDSKKTASVSKKGIVKAKKPGTAKITIASKKNASVFVTCTIYVDA